MSGPTHEPLIRKTFQDYVSLSLSKFYPYPHPHPLALPPPTDTINNSYTRKSTPESGSRNCKKVIFDEIVYGMNHILNCRYEVSYDPNSYGGNFCNCVEKPEKVRTSTEFEPVTSRCWCDALTNWFLVLLSNLHHQQTSAPSTETMSVLTQHNQYLHASILFLWRKVILPSLEESILNPRWQALRIYILLKVNNRQTFFN